MVKTQLKKLIIEKFRALTHVEVEFGEHITVVCGKNGTSKSSILGIAAQIFSFEKDYVKNEDLLSFRQIGGGSFKSQYSEHFRISPRFDIPGTMQVKIELFDGYTNEEGTATLQLEKRGKSPRLIVRNNSTATGNNSRNFTHPVVFLSLKRLYPIANRDYTVSNSDYLKEHNQKFIGLTNELLNRDSTVATSTKGTISSAVAHGKDYDQDSVSAGEDNAGQIVLALMSFQKLKEEYANYKGGLLLIDEADAGLFPTAQVNLLNILERECKNLNLQVVMTSHSPNLIEHAFEQSQKFRKKWKTIYLSNTYGDIQVMQDWSWSEISADIRTKTFTATSGTSLPRINIYFEDTEAEDFFAALMFRQPINKFINRMSGVSLGCGNYVNLMEKNVPEFASKSIICLDSDALEHVKKKNFKTLVLLPGGLPPDQLIFEHLYNLPADHDFWKNKMRFSRDVFTNSSAEVRTEFEITGSKVDVAERITFYREKEGKKKAREIFKDFYKNAQFQEVVASGTKPYNPWKHWVKEHPDDNNDFLTKFEAAIHYAMKNGYAVDGSKLSALEVKLKKG